ncbi:MAG: peptidoglycan-binding domain-containing protein [Porticoccaceae bacterium]|nr:peptidoglycan-binding domain-containing protein [Porticoccaceae bacterium]
MLRLACSIFVVCLPLQELAAQDTSSNISFNGELWSLAQLLRLRTCAPPAIGNYEVLIIYKDYLNKWVIGGDLKKPTAEMIYVDRRNRLIGPFTSSQNTAGVDYECVDRETAKASQVNQGVYNACRSDFYSPDTTIKVAQMVIACAILACLGGYDTDWFPIFRPQKLKQEILASGLMAQFEKYFQGKERLHAETRVALINDATNSLLDKLDSINEEAQDSAALRSSIERLTESSKEYNQQINEFLNETFHDTSLGFALGDSLSKKRQASETLVSMNGRIDKSLQLMTKNLKAIMLAERAIVSEIQSLLKDQSYYTYAVGGLFGVGTLKAIKTFSQDASVPVEHYDKPKLLRSVKSSFMSPVGSCSKSSTEGPFVACFSIDIY